MKRPSKPGHTFGPLLREGRKKKKREGLTWRKIANRVGWNTSYLGSVERGEYLPHAPRLKILSSTLNIPLGELQSAYVFDCIVRETRRAVKAAGMTPTKKAAE